jgi:hypothetical protein
MSTNSEHQIYIQTSQVNRTKSPGCAAAIQEQINIEIWNQMQDELIRPLMQKTMGEVWSISWGVKVAIYNQFIPRVRGQFR